MANVINSLKYNNGNAFIFALPFGSCTVGGNVQKKDITIDGISVIEEGLMIAVKFSNANTAASPTLSINSSTASPIYYKGSAIPTNAISAGATYQFIYNGTQWELIGDLDTSAAITVTTSGSGNAITSLSASGGTITVTKGSTFLTAHPTISKSTDSTSTASPSHGGTFTAVDSVTRDGNGHVTKVNTKTITLPSAASSSDTKVTNTLATTTKAYLTGTTSSTTNTGTQVFDTGVFLGTTAGDLNAGSLSIGRTSGSTIGNRSIAFGQGTTASGTCSYAEGNATESKGICSHVEGYCTKASSDYQHVQGKYNIEDTEGKYAHIVGGGTSTPKNIHTLDWDGNATFAGDVVATNLYGDEVSLANNILTKNTGVYVSTSGSDTTGDGTSSKPWRTIQHAVNMCPAVGANEAYWVINLSAGTYNEDVVVDSKHTYITIGSSSTLAASTNYKVRSITTQFCNYVALRGIYFTGKSISTSNVGVNAHYGSNVYIENCKFNDCRCVASYNGRICMSTCDLSNYQSGSTVYGAVHAVGGTIRCYSLSGSNNKVGYAAGIGSGFGGDIYVNSTCALKATTLYAELFSGRVIYGESNWTLIASVTGTNSISINNTFSEYVVIIRVPTLGTVSIYIPVTELTATEKVFTGGAFHTTSANGSATINASNTKISLIHAYLNGVAVTTNCTVVVYGKRG